MIRPEKLDDTRNPPKVDLPLEVARLKIDVKELNSHLIEIGTIVHNISGVQGLYGDIKAYIDMTKEVPEMKERITRLESKMDLLVGLFEIIVKEDSGNSK